MTLTEAIKHTLAIARAHGSCACAQDHRQLAAWLTELMQRQAADQDRTATDHPGDLTSEEVQALCAMLENQVYPAKNPARRAYQKILDAGAQGAGLVVRVRAGST